MPVQKLLRSWWLAIEMGGNKSESDELIPQPYPNRTARAITKAYMYIPGTSDFPIVFSDKILALP